MPPRKSNVNTETKVEQPVVVKSESKKSEPKTESKKEQKEKPETKTKAKTTGTKSGVPKVKKPIVRKEKPSKENILTDLTNLTEQVNVEIQRNRQEKHPGNKFLNSHHKLLKTLYKRLLPVLKCKTKRNVSADSGFNTPIKISPELAAFIGYDAGKLVSRVEASKLVSEYIKSKGLYNSQAKLIYPDAKLQALFGPMKSKTNLSTLEVVTGKKDGAFKWIGQLQKLMKCHLTTASATA